LGDGYFTLLISYLHKDFLGAGRTTQKEAYSASFFYLLVKKKSIWNHFADMVHLLPDIIL
jgi:hypothetical protein